MFRQSKLMYPVGQIHQEKELMWELGSYLIGLDRLGTWVTRYAGIIQLQKKLCSVGCPRKNCYGHPARQQLHLSGFQSTYPNDSRFKELAIREQKRS
ncbi:hypothetical protein ACLB2K_060499 [Fragaria x ananassa]